MDLELKEIGQFNGTEKYYNVMGVNVTDGIHYLMENGYSWIITDFIAVAKFNKRIKAEGFVCVELKLNYGFKLNPAIMLVTDGNGNRLYEQEYKWTDAKRELKLFFADNVLMLNSEY